MLGKLPGLLLGLRLDGECRPFMEMQIPLYLLLPKILPETTLYRHRLHPTRSGGASGGEGPRTIYPSRGLYEDRWVGRRDWEGVRHQWSKREKLLTFLWTHPKGHKSRFDWRLCTIYKRRLETSRKPSINVCVPWLSGRRRFSQRGREQKVVGVPEGLRGRDRLGTRRGPLECPSTENRGHLPVGRGTEVPWQQLNPPPGSNGDE